MKTRNKITGNSKLKDVLGIKGAEEILKRYKLPCLSCPMAAFEIAELEIGQVAKMYKIDLKNLLKELNKLNCH